MSNEKVTYILQKDLPDCKAGVEYQITENGENYVCYDTPIRKNMLSNNWAVCYGKEFVENNPEWFKLKEEKPIVNRCNYSDTHVYFHLSGEIPEIEITKERLAEVLISVENGEFDGKGDYWKFNQQEYLRFGEECFNSAREYNNKDQSSFSSSWIKYKSFSDYMNRIK